MATQKNVNSEKGTGSAPKLASREARYKAVMKYHQRIIETGSSGKTNDNANPAITTSPPPSQHTK